MKILFIDTNLFLQCQDLSTLPWNEIDCGDLLLLIPRPVQEEIDNLKNDGNSRRAKRARKATSYIRQVILVEDSRMTIRDSTPKVEISFPPPLFPEDNLRNILDLSRADDQIIAQAITYKTINPDADVAILTHDTNPILTAKRVGLPCIVVPDDWLLPPEPDARDKRIEELERRLKELEKTHPEIEVIGQDAEGKRMEFLSVSVRRYRDFTELELKEILAEVKAKYPIVINYDESERKHIPTQEVGFSQAYNLIYGVSNRYEPPKEEEIRVYKEVKYPQWLEEIEKFFKSLPSRLEFLDRHVDFLISINNKGNVPAENVLVEFMALGGLLLKAPVRNNKEDIETSLFEIPSPPPAPKGKWIREKNSFLSMMDTIGKMSQVGIPSQDLIRNFRGFPGDRPRDRYAFYWKNDRPSGYQNSWTFECEEFRHQVDPEIFEIVVCVSREINTDNGALKCRVTAKNLPRPFEYTLPVKIKYVQKDAIKESRGLLEKLTIK